MDDGALLRMGVLRNGAQLGDLETELNSATHPTTRAGCFANSITSAHNGSDGIARARCAASAPAALPLASTSCTG
jgi:hypothetical protein